MYQEILEKVLISDPLLSNSLEVFDILLLEDLAELLIELCNLLWACLSKMVGQDCLVRIAFEGIDATVDQQADLDPLVVDGVDVLVELKLAGLRVIAGQYLPATRNHFLEANGASLQHCL